MHADKVEGKKGKRRVVNVVEIGDESVYVRLADGKKYLLNGDGCWRCGSTAKCFGNMIDDTELEVVCEFDFYDEVRCLFLLLLQNRLNKTVSWLSDRVHSRVHTLIDRLVGAVVVTIELANLKK